MFQHNARGCVGVYRTDEEVQLRNNTFTDTVNRVPVDRSHSAIRMEGNTITDNTVALWAGVKVHYSTVAFEGNTIANNTALGAGADVAGGVFSQGSTVTMTGDRIVNNTGSGFLSYAYASGYTNDIVLSTDPDNPTWIFGNGDYGVRNETSYRSSNLGDDHNIDARNVWWDTTDETAIQTAIYDHTDNGGRGVVFYLPYAIPEPATLALLALGGLALVKRRKRLSH